jgi:hypothetical protein
MCDPTPIRNWLIALVAALVLAVAAIVVAIVTNGSIVLAWMSPGWMFGAAALTGGGIVACIFATMALDTFCKCAGTRCEGACGNMRRLILAIQLVLGIQALACITVGLISWIPFAPQPLMWVIEGALVAQLLLVISLFPFYSSLTSCQSSARPA